MIHYDAHQTFRGLPLTTEQEAEVRHYLNRQRRLGKPWNTPELRAMLKDMLLPPSAEDDGQSDATRKRQPLQNAQRHSWMRPWSQLRPTKNGSPPWKRRT